MKPEDSSSTSSFPFLFFSRSMIKSLVACSQLTILFTISGDVPQFLFFLLKSQSNYGTLYTESCHRIQNLKSLQQFLVKVKAFVVNCCQTGVSYKYSVCITITIDIHSKQERSVNMLITSNPLPLLLELLSLVLSIVPPELAALCRYLGRRSDILCSLDLNRRIRFQYCL